MSKIALIQKIRDIYARGENVLRFLEQNSNMNDWESIMISYDFQAGTYTKLAAEKKEYFDAYTAAIAAAIPDLHAQRSILEVGVGEATVMNPLMAKIDPHGTMRKQGFDISWSRVRYAKQNALAAGNNSDFFTANLFNIPLPDNSVDIVYTSHSLEPNGGKEKEALRELYRVANHYVVLLEPDYENATPQGRERMQHHGYVKDLARHAAELGFEVVTNRAFDVSINPLNPTGLTIIRKATTTAVAADGFICPITRTQLSPCGGALFSREAGLIYPIIDGIPCLLEGAVILGVHFGEFNQVT